MCTQEAKHNQIIDLLDAHTTQKEISKIIGVTERTVHHIQHATKLGRGRKRSPGSGGRYKKRNKIFLKTLKEKIMESPTISMRRHAKTLNLDPKTIRTAVNLGLGLKSFFRKPQHLTKSIKQKRFDRCKKIISFLKHSDRTITVFSNKKTFTVDKFIKE